jgi:NodT family efflux transporter outer membrane factor (OMF) lipoprotein
LRAATTVLLVGVALASSGCGAKLPWMRNGFKVGPNYCRPPAPVAPAWIEAENPLVDSRHVLYGDWWSVFQDPTLNSLVGRSYRQNLDLRVAGTRVFQARAQQAIVVGNLLPQTQQLLGVYSHGSLGGDSVHLDVTGFNLAWELDFWGKYRRQVESANAKLDASVESYDNALVTLLADVATYYVQYRVAQQRIEIARQNLQSQQRLVTVAEEQRNLGTAIELDVAQLRTLMEQTKSSIPALQIEQGRANDRLCVLLGEPPHDLTPELGPGPQIGALPMPVVPATAAVGIPADLLRRRPDIRSAERQIAAQSAQIGVAAADLYPSLSIGTTLGVADIGLSPVMGTSGALAFVTPSFRWNILNYGRLANNVRLQDAKTAELVATYQNQVLIAAGEVQTALRGFLRSQEQASDLARGAAAAVTATQIEEQLFTNVKADVNRLFNLENSRLQVQNQLAVAQGNIALNLISVYRALGGGWELRLRQPLDAPMEHPHEPSPAPAAPTPENVPTPLPMADPKPTVG